MLQGLPGLEQDVVGLIGGVRPLLMSSTGQLSALTKECRVGESEFSSLISGVVLVGGGVGLFGGRGLLGGFISFSTSVVLPSPSSPPVGSLFSSCGSNEAGPGGVIDVVL